jgi:DNA-binding transcriptional regulator GbsR (MarR family)
VTRSRLPPPMRRFIDYLGELGPRWGLPSGPCRVHGYLYAIARPATEADLRGALDLKGPELAEALTWLTDFRLVTRADGAWRTDTDPWELLLRALEERRRREIDPALDLLRDCQREMTADGAGGKTASAQIAKLIALVEDLAAIDMQARRLSPQTLRRLVGLGGRVGRLINRTLRTGDQR